jgi:hypothetical protein
MHVFPLEVGLNKRNLLLLNVSMQTDSSLILAPFAFSDEKFALDSTCLYVRQSLWKQWRIAK